MDTRPYETSAWDGEIRRMKVRRTSFEVLVIRPGRPSSFGAVLDQLRERTRKNELTVIDGDATVYGAEESLGPKPLVDSIGRAAACIPLASLRVRENFELGSPWLVGSPHSVRYVCSFATRRMANRSMTESYVLRTSFTAFARLWTGPKGVVENWPREMSRRIDALAIGRRMGDLHNMPVMWTDAHRNQFAWRVNEAGDPDTSKDMIVLDLFYETGEGRTLFSAGSWPLYRPPTQAQCATMLVPLLSYFEYSSEYGAFAMGYVAQRGDAGRDVLNYIEVGDRTGWRRALDSKHFEIALGRARAQLDEGDEEDPDAYSHLLSIVGLSCSHLGRYEEACAAYGHAIAVIQASDSGGMGVTQFNLGQAHYRAGHRDLAAAEFRAVIKREEERPSTQGLLAAARTMLSRC